MEPSPNLVPRTCSRCRAALGDDRHRRCATCRAYVQGCVRGLWKSRRELGLCRSCGEPIDGMSPVHCSECLAVDRESKRARYGERVRARRCIIDDRPAVAGVFCLDCWFKMISYERLGSRAHWRAIRALWERQQRRCAYSGEPLIPGFNASLDHRIPVSRGGSNELSNLQWVTVAANRMKSNMTEEEFFFRCQAVVAFHDDPEGYVSNLERAFSVAAGYVN